MQKTLLQSTHIHMKKKKYGIMSDFMAHKIHYNSFLILVTRDGENACMKEKLVKSEHYCLARQSKDFCTLTTHHTDNLCAIN